MKKKISNFLSDVLRIVHLTILAVYIASVISLFVPSYRLYGAIYIVAIRLIERAAGNYCPLTYAENKLKGMSEKDSVKRGLIRTLSKKYFEISITNKTVGRIMDVIALIGIVIIVMRVI